MTVNIELISQTDLADESFYIAINGLEPRAMYCVEMYLSDYYCINAPLLLDHNVMWKSTAIFLSDKDGIIDTSQTASISGSYKGISEMGLFFNAKPLKNRKRRLPSSLDRIPLRDCFGVEIIIGGNDDGNGGNVIVGLCVDVIVEIGGNVIIDADDDDGDDDDDDDTG